MGRKAQENGNKSKTTNPTPGGLLLLMRFSLPTHIERTSSSSGGSGVNNESQQCVHQSPTYPMSEAREWKFSGVANFRARWRPPDTQSPFSTKLTRERNKKEKQNPAAEGVDRSPPFCQACVTHYWTYLSKLLSLDWRSDGWRECEGNVTSFFYPSWSIASVFVFSSFMCVYVCVSFCLLLNSVFYI